MTKAEFNKLKDLFNCKIQAIPSTGVSTQGDKTLRKLWDIANLETTGPIFEWVRKSKYDFDDPLKMYWGI